LNASTKFFFFFRNSPKCWLYIIGLHEGGVSKIQMRSFIVIF